jgi:tRNA(Phe) wybutosine-synthesizing methylase Tyw3
MNRKVKKDTSNNEILTELRISFAKLEEQIKGFMTINATDHNYMKTEIKICNDELGRAEIKMTSLEKEINKMRETAFKLKLFWKIIVPILAAIGGAAIPFALQYLAKLLGL